MPETQIVASAFTISSGGGPDTYSATKNSIIVITPDGMFNVYPPVQGPTAPNNGCTVEVDYRFTNTGPRAEFCFKCQTVSDEPGMPPGDIISTPWDIVEPGQLHFHAHWLRFGAYGALVKTWIYARPPGGGAEQLVIPEYDFRIDTRPVPPSQATHILVIDFLKLPWFNLSLAESYVEFLSVVANAVNPIIQPLGFQFIKVEYVDQDAGIGTGSVYVYYQQSGSPVFPLATVLTVVKILAVLLIVGLVVWGVREIIVGKEAEYTKQVESKTDFANKIADLVAAGKLTPEQAKEMMDAYNRLTGKEPPYWMLAVLGGVVLLSEEGKKREGKKK